MCGAFATKARKSIVVETSFEGALLPLYASALIAYDGPVYARLDAARWSRDCTSIEEFLGLIRDSTKTLALFFVSNKALRGRAWDSAVHMHSS